MIKNCSTCKHSPVDEHCKGCKGENDGNTHWEPEELDLTRIVFETLAECGIYGEEATIKFIGTLKRLGRIDLLPPCAR